MDTKIQEKIIALAEVITGLLNKEFGDLLTSVCLYGSAARGQLKVNSDMDFLIILEHISQRRLRLSERVIYLKDIIYETAEFIALKNSGYYPAPHFTIKSKLNIKNHPPLLLDMTQEGIILYDKEDFLKNVLKGLKERMRELGTVRRYLPDGDYYWVWKPDLKPGETVEL